MEAPVVSKESKTQTEQAAKRQVNSPIVTSEEKVQKSQTPVIAKSRTDIEVKEEKPDAGNPTVSFTQKKDQVNSASEARMGGDNSKHKFSLVDSVNAPNVFGVTGSISKAVENAKSQDTPEISATVSNLLGGFPFKMVGAAIGGGLATAMLGNIFGRSKIKSEEESTQGAIDPQSGQAQQSVAASNRGNLVPGLLGKMFGRSKDDFEESSPQSPETLAGNSLITTNKEPIADTSNDSPFNQAKVDTQNPVDTDSLGMEFGDSIHDSNEGLRKTDASSAPANNSGPAMFDQKPAVTDSLGAEFGVSLHYSKEELRKTDAPSAPANTPGPAMFDKSLPDQSKVPDKEPAESKFDAFKQSISDTTTPEPPAEPSTPEAVWIDKPLPPSPAKGTVSNNSKPSPWRSNRSPWKSKTATSAPTVFGSTGSVPSTSTKGKTIIDAEWKKATSLEEGSTQKTAPPHEIGNTNDPATFDEKAGTKVEASNSSSDAERTGANLESMASASSAPDESKAKAPYTSESKPKVPPTPADPVSSTSGPSRRSSIDSARTGSVSTGDNHHSSLEDNFPTTASEEKPETSVGAGMSYLDSMSAKTSAPDWSKAKAPKTPDSPPPPVALPSPQSASSDSSAKVPSASEKTSSTSASYLDSMSANTAAPDWSNAKTPTTPDNPPLSPPPVAPVSPESTPVAPVSPESTPEKTLSDENSTGRGYIEIMNANPADKEWSSAKAPSPSESLLVSPPRLSATGEGSPVSPSADVTPDDPLFKTVRAESKGEVPTQVDSMAQKGMSSNASTPMHSTNLEDRANETNPYDLSNSSSKSNFVDRFTTSKGNSTSTYSVNEGASDEHSKQKGDPSNTEAINLESEADEGCVAPSDSKGMTSASNPAENTGPKKSAFMTIERTKKEKLSADTKLKKLARDAPISAKRPTSEKKIVAKALPTGNRMKKDRRSPPKGNNGPTVIKSDVHAPAPHKSPAAPMKNNLDVKAGPTRKKAIANVHSSVGIDKSTAKKKSKGRNGPPEPNQTPLEKKVATDKVPEKNGPEEPKEMTSKGKHEQGNVHASFKSTPPPEKKLVPTTNYLEKPRQGKTGPPVKKSDNAVRTKSLTPLEKRFCFGDNDEHGS
jgi:hypothetical protein